MWSCVTAPSSPAQAQHLHPLSPSAGTPAPPLDPPLTQGEPTLKHTVVVQLAAWAATPEVKATVGVMCLFV